MRGCAGAALRLEVGVLFLGGHVDVVPLGLLLDGATLALEAVLPHDEGDDGDKGDAANDSAGYGADIGLAGWGGAEGRVDLAVD